MPDPCYHPDQHIDTRGDFWSSYLPYSVEHALQFSQKWPQHIAGILEDPELAVFIFHSYSALNRLIHFSVSYKMVIKKKKSLH